MKDINNSKSLNFPKLITGSLFAFSPFGAFADLLSHHEFEGDFTDSSENGHTGTSQGDGMIVVDPERGNVYETPPFNFARSYLDVDQTVSFPNLPANTNLTLAVWVQRDDYEAGTNGLFGPGNLVAALSLGAGGDTPIASIGVNNAGGVNGFIEGDGGADQVQITSNDGLVPNEIWTHIAVTFDRINDVAKLYVDGSQVGADFDISVVGDGELDWAGAQIGTLAAPGNANFDFQGRIDDARIYDEALSATQIAELATRPASPGLPEINEIVRNPDGTATLTWKSDPTAGITYTLRYDSTLEGDPLSWTSDSNIIATGGTSTTFTTTTIFNETKMFFVVEKND